LISGMEVNPDLFAAILRNASSGHFGTSLLAKELHVGPAKLVKFARELHDRGLAEIQAVHSNSAGRPSVKIVPTSLGYEYLEAYEALCSRILKSRRSDLLRAVADAKYACRLAERGLSPVLLSLELNSLVVPLRRPPD